MGTNAIRATGAAPLANPRRDALGVESQGGARFSEVLAARGQAPQQTTGAPTHATAPAHAPSAAAQHAYGVAPAGTEPLTEAGRRLLSRISRGERFVEQVVRGASSGAAYTPADLLAIQAQVYRYTQEVELVSKFVDRATNAVKTVLQQGS
ncbi:MAG: hypothetical protein JNK05_34105 [Myxococcales bacterium]|nr:hypothetical protein [Myxococcales bacterium]